MTLVQIFITEISSFSQFAEKHFICTESEEQT